MVNLDDPEEEKQIQLCVSGSLLFHLVFLENRALATLLDQSAGVSEPFSQLPGTGNEKCVRKGGVVGTDSQVTTHSLTRDQSQWQACRIRVISLNKYLFSFVLSEGRS